MQITRTETTFIPQCPEGRKFANEYTHRLKSQGAFLGRKDSTEEIVIMAKYSFELKGIADELGE